MKEKKPRKPRGYYKEKILIEKDGLQVIEFAGRIGLYADEDLYDKILVDGVCTGYKKKLSQSAKEKKQ